MTFNRVADDVDHVDGTSGSLADDLRVVAPALSGGRALLRAPVAAATWRAVSQVVVGFPVLLAAGIGVLTAGSTAFGLVVLGVGIPLGVALLAATRPAARIERARLRAQLCARIEPPYYPARTKLGTWRRWRTYFGDSRTWAHLAYAPVAMALSSLELVVLGVIGAAMGLVAAPLIGVRDWPGVTVVALCVGGVVGMWVGAILTQALALVHVRLARGLLGASRSLAAVEAARIDAQRARDRAQQAEGRAQQEQDRAQQERDRAEQAEDRAQHLDQTRTRAVGAADDDRRRIERDLHDGAQQRLVALGVELGAAKRAASTDPQAAAAVIDHAHREIKETLAELRDLVRGIHPAVLTDRGLDAALSALAARCPVPVDVQVTGTLTQASTAAQAAAYFVTAETLTNVARHAGATCAWVSAEVVGDRLRLEVTDDGRGGADARPGGGLEGLRSRVAALDGSFTLDSPIDCGTRVTVEVPCA